MVYIGISYSVDFIWDFPIVIGKPIHFGDSWLDPPVLLPSPYHNPLLDLFQIFYTLLTSLNVRISRGLEQFHSLSLAKKCRGDQDTEGRLEPSWRTRHHISPMVIEGIPKATLVALVSRARPVSAMHRLHPLHVSFRPETHPLGPSPM